MGDFLNAWSEANEASAEFLLVDLDTALTFMDLARDSKNPETVERNRKHAREAYDTVLRLLPKVALDAEQSQGIHDRLAALKSRLATEAGQQL
jgi:hypothetical protein